MRNNKIKRNKQRNRISCCTRKQDYFCYDSSYDSKRKNLFISGMGSVLNLFGNSSTCNFNHEMDLEALNYDWFTVGQDISKAMEGFELEHSDKLSSLLSK